MRIQMQKVEEEAAFGLPANTAKNSTVVTLSIVANAGEPHSLPPLADGQVPACAERPGKRTLRSEVVSSHSSTVSMLASSVRNSKGCEFHIELDIANAARTESVVLGNNSKFEFHIIDFAPNGSSLLLDQLSDRSPKEIALLDNSRRSNPVACLMESLWMGPLRCYGRASGFTADDRIVE